MMSSGHSDSIAWSGKLSTWTSSWARNGGSGWDHLRLEGLIVGKDHGNTQYPHANCQSRVYDELRCSDSSRRGHTRLECQASCNIITSSHVSTCNRAYQALPLYFFHILVDKQTSGKDVSVERKQCINENTGHTHPFEHLMTCRSYVPTNVL